MNNNTARNLSSDETHPNYEGVWEPRNARLKKVLTMVRYLDEGRVEVALEDGTHREMLGKSLATNYKRVQVTTPTVVLPVVVPSTELGPERLALKNMFIKNRHEGESITTVYTLLTPSLATELLACNPLNRTPGTSRAKTMARDMKVGHWAKSDQGMALSPDLTLGNGQHRCMAVLFVAESDKNFKGVPMAFSWYQDRNEFEVARLTWDSGTKRSKGGSLEIAGLIPKGYGSVFAAIVKQMSYVDGRIGSSQTISETEDTYIERQGAIDAAAKLDKKEFQAPVKAAFALAHMKDPKAIDEAITLVSTKVGYEKGSAAHALVLKIPELQRNHDRTQVIQDVLSLLYKHVKGHTNVKHVRNNMEAYRYFLGDNYRPLASK